MSKLVLISLGFLFVGLGGVGLVPVFVNEVVASIDHAALRFCPFSA